MSTFLFFFFHLFPFAKLSLKGWISERTAKVPKLRFYRPNLTWYPGKAHTENLGPQIKIVGGAFWGQNCSECVYKWCASLTRGWGETRHGVLGTTDWLDQGERPGCLLFTPSIAPVYILLLGAWATLLMEKPIFIPSHLSCPMSSSLGTWEHLLPPPTPFQREWSNQQVPTGLLTVHCVVCSRRWKAKNL